MMAGKSRGRPIGTWAAVIAVATVGGLTLTLVSPVRAVPLSQGPQANDVIGVYDDLLMFVANKVPEYAGSYVEGSTLVVRVVGGSSTAAEKARTQLAASLHAPEMSDQPLEVQSADYSFKQLRDWYETSRMDVLGIDGVTFGDIDERTNKIAIGVEDLASVEPVVRNKIDDLGIPQAVVTVEQRNPPTLASSVRDWHRPLLGGLQIQSLRTFGLCTLGFVMVRAGFEGYVTASHCGIFHQLTGDGYGQPTGELTSWYIGWEVDDANYIPGGLWNPCPPGDGCVWVDAEADRRLVQAGAVNRGYIARTGILSTTSWDGVSKWRITGERTGTVGEEVGKQGRSSGLSFGTITRSCADILATDDIWRLCSWQAEFNASIVSGDSGSPVFHRVSTGSTDVKLLGILWGGSGFTGNYSPLASMQKPEEFGPMTNCAPGFAC